MEKRSVRGLEIEIFNLQDKTYNYDFEVGDNFFQGFDDSLINKGNAKVDIILKKSIAFIALNIKISGAVELVCDRSLEHFDYPVEIENDLIFKYGEAHLELDEFMIQIPQGTERIQLSQFIYEFISLAIPMKKLHPKFADAEEEEEGTLVYSSPADPVEDKPLDDEPSEEKIDPRWQKLNELRNKK